MITCQQRPLFWRHVSKDVIFNLKKLTSKLSSNFFLNLEEGHLWKIMGPSSITKFELKFKLNYSNLILNHFLSLFVPLNLCCFSSGYFFNDFFEQILCT